MASLFSRPKVQSAPVSAIADPKKTEAEIDLEKLKARQKFAAQAGRKSQRKSIVNQLSTSSGGVSGSLT